MAADIGFGGRREDRLVGHDGRLVRREAIDVLTRARGEEGVIIRKNAQKLGEELLNYWAPNGAGWNELRRIIDVVN